MKHFPALLLLSAALLAGCEEKMKPVPEDPLAPGTIVARLNAAHGRSELGDLAYDIGDRLRNQAPERSVETREALLGTLDLSRFDHAFFLVLVAEYAGFPESPKVDAALAALRWPKVPSSWTPEDCATTFTHALGGPHTAAYPPGLSAARLGLARRLWAVISQAEPLQAGLQRIEGTPMRALVDALTAAFDLRVLVVCEGTDEIEKRDAGTDALGKPITAIGLKEIRTRVERAMARLLDEAFGSVAPGLKPVAGADGTGAPATIEVRFTVESTDKLLEAFFIYVYGMRVTATVTLKAGAQEWPLGTWTETSDEKISYDASEMGLAEGVLVNVLEKLNRRLIAELLRKR